MQAQNDSSRILRVAAWIWIGYLIAMLMMDLVLYAPFSQQAITQNPPFQQDIPGQQLPPFGNPQSMPQPRHFGPIFLFYAANGAVAFLFLLFTYWKWPQDQFGGVFYPLLVLMISTTPIIINTLIVPRFPQGPLSNAEGMALRQLPVLFVALALVAWEYQLPHVVFFSVATTALELGLIVFNVIDTQSVYVFIFIAIIRTITFVATGIFLNLLVTRLREQQESLQQANVNLTHYASTLEQLTVSRERNRLARELHDTLAHSLTAISVSLETAKAYFDIEPKKSQEFLDKSLDATRTGIDETRRALKALRSSLLEDMGLGPAIRQVAESAATRFKLDLDLALPTPMPSLSPDVEQTILRITQEAIENITHHSRANKFTIRLESNGHTTLTIRDNGVGFDMRSKEPTGHFGLIGMRERAELAGGKLKIESEKGKGTKVVLTI